MPIPVTYTCPQCACHQSVDVIPSRPAPPCSNPDSPAFSDSGDPGEVDQTVCVNCGHEISDEDVEALLIRAEEKSYEP